MRVPYLSATRMKMIKDCTYAYQMQYDPPSQEARVLKEMSNHPKNLPAAYLGTNLHNALEEWRRPDPETGKTPKPRLPRLMELYKEESKKNLLPANMYEDGKRMLLRWFDRRGKDPVRVLAVEMAFGSHRAPYMTEHGVPIFGMIDLVLEHKDGTIELLDYKSQRAPITQAEADTDVQAGMYLTVAREIWPDRPLVFTFDLLRYGTVSSVWPEDRIASFSEWLATQYAYITNLKEGTPNISSSCQYCSYQSLCPRVADLKTEDLWDTVLNANGWENDNEMLEELQRVKYAQGILNKQRTKIEDEVKARLAGVDPDDARIETDEWTLHWGTQDRNVYVPSEVQRHVDPIVFGQLVTINKSKLDTAMDNILDDETVREIRGSAIKKFGRRLSIRRRPPVE